MVEGVSKGPSVTSATPTTPAANDQIPASGQYVAEDGVLPASKEADLRASAQGTTTSQPESREAAKRKTSEAPKQTTSDKVATGAAVANTALDTAKKVDQTLSTAKKAADLGGKLGSEKSANTGKVLDKIVNSKAGATGTGTLAATSTVINGYKTVEHLPETVAAIKAYNANPTPENKAKMEDALLHEGKYAASTAKGAQSTVKAVKTLTAKATSTAEKVVAGSAPAIEKGATEALEKGAAKVALKAASKYLNPVASTAIAASDIHDAYKTIHDPNATGGQKTVAVVNAVGSSLTAAGTWVNATLGETGVGAVVGTTLEVAGAALQIGAFVAGWFTGKK